MAQSRRARRRFVVLIAYAALLLTVPAMLAAIEITSWFVLAQRGELRYPLFISPAKQQPVKPGAITNQPWFDTLDPLLSHAYSVDYLKRGMPEFWVSEGFVAYANPAEKNRLRIFALGGSTTEPYFMMRANDPSSYSHESWPFFLQQRLDALGIPAIVFNGGVAGYSTNQELLKLLRDVLPLQPDIVLSLSGVNDQGFAHSDKLHPMIHPHQARTFAALAAPPPPTRFLPNTGALARHLLAPEPPLHVSLGPEVRTAPWTQWERNLRLMHAACSEMGTPFLAFRQPAIGVGQHTPTADESAMLQAYIDSVSKPGATVTYADVLRLFYDHTNDVPGRLPYCVDLVDIFGDTPGAYRDARHQTAVGARMIADAMLAELQQRHLLANRQASAPELDTTQRPTYAEHVAPLLDRACTNCHRPNGAGPMALQTYEQVRPWANQIRRRVSDRTMPPFGAEGPKGFFAHDPRLGEDDIAIVARWIDAGCPRGTGTPAITAATSHDPWDEHAPDLVTAALTPDLITPDNADQWWFTFFDYVAPGDRWLQGLRVLTEGDGVVHHTNIFTMDAGYTVPPEDKISGNAHLKESQLLALWAPGRPPLWCPDGIAVPLAAGTRFGANIHYAPTTTARTHTLRLALYFADGPIRHALEMRVAQVNKNAITVPPNAAGVRLTESQSFGPEGAIVYAFAGHMHYRGAALLAEIDYPDGTKNTNFQIPRFNFNWQQQYELATPMPIPADSTIALTAVFDNSSANPMNPNPAALVNGGFRTEDEMAELYFQVVNPTRALDIIVNDGIPATAQ